VRPSLNHNPATRKRIAKLYGMRQDTLEAVFTSDPAHTLSLAFPIPQS